MGWRKEISVHDRRALDLLLIIVIALVIIGLIMKQPIIYLFTGLFGAYLMITILYDRHIGNKLKLENEHTMLKLFPSEEGKLTFELQNRSIIPMVNGELQFRVNRNIHFTNHASIADKYWRVINIPLSVTGKKKVKASLSFIANERGVVKVTNINYSFPHLLQFDRIRMDYELPYLPEIIVFPEPLPVQQVNTAFINYGGAQRFPFSPMEDLLVPLGTKEYSFDDPFHRINWKATAKSQKMQTNVYERVIDMSYVFIINVDTNDDGRGLSPSFEELLSYTTYLAQYATENDFPYEIYINARKPGKTPYVHLPEGQGKIHYSHSLEMLARIPKEPMALPFEQMLFRINQQLTSARTIIVIGDLTADAEEIINRWEKRHHIFKLDYLARQAILNPWKRGMKNAQ